MPLTRELHLSPRHALGAATVAALVVGLVTGAQAYLARAGSAAAIPFGLAVQNRTFAALSWVLVGIGVVAAARRWPIGRETWKQVVPIHFAAAVAAGCSVNLILHTVLWLLGADQIAFVRLADVILRDTLDHAHLNLLVYAVIVGVVWSMAAVPDADAQGRYASRLTARRRDTLTVVAVDEVDWIEGADDYACLHVGTRRHLTDDRLVCSSRRSIRHASSASTGQRSSTCRVYARSETVAGEMLSPCYTTGLGFASAGRGAKC